MFLFWFLVPLCYADPSILIVGGDGGKGTVEKFDPSTMKSTIITLYDQLVGRVHLAPVNNTHAIISVINDGKITVYYIDSGGTLNPRPLMSRVGGEYSDIVSLCDANGRRQVIICFDKICEILSEDGSKYHSTMASKPASIIRGLFTLTAFGHELIAIASCAKVQNLKPGLGPRFIGCTERYNGSKWSTVAPPPDQSRGDGISTYGSTAVKLNDAQLLSCGDLDEPRTCFIYNLDSDTWVDAPETKSSVSYAELAMLDKTVFAFGGSVNTDGNFQTSSAIQTLDVSHGVNGKDKPEWQLQSAEMMLGREMLGVWVLDGSHQCPTADESTTVTTSGSMVTDHLISMILMALLLSA